VGVSCTLDELLRRETARGDRMAGLARYQHRRVHWPRPHYDLEVDTTAEPAAALARAILGHISSKAPFAMADLAAMELSGPARPVT
jgi:chloramphenicol 3-O phosphotransferase